MFDNDMMQLVQALQTKNGIAEMVNQPMYAQEGDDEPTVSQADIIADIINLMRLDIKKIAETQDVEIEIKRMRPEQAAILIQGLIEGDDLGLVETFNGIEEQRETLLEEILDEEEYEKHLATKDAVLFSNEDREREPINPEARQALENAAESHTDAERGMEMKAEPTPEPADESHAEKVEAAPNDESE